jgi:hypothetical protein
MSLLEHSQWHVDHRWQDLHIWITLYPSDFPQPNASNLNFTDNQIVPNSFTVGLGADGAFNIYSHDTNDPGPRNYTFTFTQRGTYNALLEVLNDQNRIAVSFNGTGSDPGGSITKYEWDFNGDGVYDYMSTTTAATK